jgi:hypothetical protein
MSDSIVEVPLSHRWWRNCGGHDVSLVWDMIATIRHPTC